MGGIGGQAAVGGASNSGGAAGAGTAAFGGTGTAGSAGLGGSTNGGAAGSSGAGGAAGTGSSVSQVCSNYCELWFLDRCVDLLDTYEGYVDCIPLCEAFSDAQKRCRTGELFTIYQGTAADRDPHCWYAIGERDAPPECL